MKMTNKYYSPLSPKLRDFLIAEYIGGKSIYFKYDEKTRYELMKGALQEFKRDIILKYGTRKNYEEINAKRLGFKNFKEQRKVWLNIAGFDTYKEYNNYLAITEGFKSQYDKETRRLNKQGLSHYSYYKNLADKKGVRITTYLGRKKKTLEKKICLGCGNVFSTNYSNKVYCSKKCQNLINCRNFRKKFPEKIKEINRKQYQRRKLK